MTSSNKQLNILDIPANYKGLEKQKEALIKLWSLLSDQERTEITAIWRSAKPLETKPFTSPATNNIPPQAIALIKEFEGYSSTVYDDGVGVATIGYGTTIYPNGVRVKFGDRPITEAEAIIYSNHDLKTFWGTLGRTIPFWKDMGDNQRSALLSFAYNLGAHFFNSDGFRTISASLTKKHWNKIPQDFLLYVNPGSNVEAGLKRRREREGTLWRT